jgi:hypothetical protein
MRAIVSGCSSSKAQMNNAKTSWACVQAPIWRQQVQVESFASTRVIQNCVSTKPRREAKIEIRAPYSQLGKLSAMRPVTAYHPINSVLYGIFHSVGVGTYVLNFSLHNLKLYTMRQYHHHQRQEPFLVASNPTQNHPHLLSM